MLFALSQLFWLTLLAKPLSADMSGYVRLKDCLTRRNQVFIDFAPQTDCPRSHLTEPRPRLCVANPRQPVTRHGWRGVCPKVHMRPGADPTPYKIEAYGWTP